MLRKINFKKGVSPVIGYILLITFVIIISIIIYQWVKTYIPREALECPDGVSIFIKEKKVDCSNNPLYLNLTLKNNGRFNISGYFIRYSELPGMLATKSLWDKIIEGRIPGRVTFASDIESQKNEFGPGDEQEDNFTFGSGLSKKISFIEIIPVRYEEIDNRLRLSSCSDAKIIEVICSDIVDCEPALDPCGSSEYTCGTAVPNGECDDITCGDNSGVCPNGFICSNEGGGSCNTDCTDGIVAGDEECDGGLNCIEAGLLNECTCEAGYIADSPPAPSCVAAPDLIVSMVGNPIISGQGGNLNHISVELLVTNQGTDVADLITWEINTDSGDTNPSLVDYPSLAAGQFVNPNPTLEWDYSVAGTYNPVIWIDPPIGTGSILESDETNNEGSIGTITCVESSNKVTCS